jgi:hypothetical protein
VSHPKTGRVHGFNGIIDTGAPRTEFSDTVLVRAGFIEAVDQNVQVKPGLQTQKYKKLILPKLEICGHALENFEVYISKWDSSWEIGALIGLDFFRRFRVTIDYQSGTIATESF